MRLLLGRPHSRLKSLTTRGQRMPRQPLVYRQLSAPEIVGTSRHPASMRRNRPRPRTPVSTSPTSVCAQPARSRRYPWLPLALFSSYWAAFIAIDRGEGGLGERD